MRCMLLSLPFLKLSYLCLLRSHHYFYYYYCPACVSSLRTWTCSYPSHQTLQYIWLYLVPQPRPLFNQRTCLYFNHGCFHQYWVLLKLCHTHTTCFLWSSHPHELPNLACPWTPTSWFLSWGASAPVCCLAIQYDLARCVGWLCFLQCPPQELQQAWSRPDYPKTILLGCHGWKFCVVLGPRLLFHRIEHVQLGLLDCSQEHCHKCVVWNKHWNGDEYPYLWLGNNFLHN